MIALDSCTNLTKINPSETPLCGVNVKSFKEVRADESKATAEKERTTQSYLNNSTGVGKLESD